MAMAIPLRVLMVEDNEVDMQLLLHQLREGGFAPEPTRVDTMAKALGEQVWDLIICDYTLPRFDAPFPHSQVDT